MRNIISRLFANLLPGGIAWFLFGDKAKVFDGIGTFFNRQKEYLQATVSESQPINSIEELPNWYNALGITYDASVPLQSRQARASQLFTSLGGQSIAYLRRQLQIAFPEIDFVPYQIPFDSMAGRGMAGKMVATNYPSWVPLELQDGTFPTYAYLITGTVESPDDFTRLQDVIARLFPAHLTPYYLDIEFYPETMMAGYGRAGRGMAGRYPDQEPVNPIAFSFNDDDGLLFTSRYARFNGLGKFDGKTLLNGQANLNVTTIKLGTGTTAPDISDTDLETIVWTAPAIITTNFNGTRNYRITVDKASLIGETITEAGLFGSFGMVWRGVFAGTEKTNEEIITFEFIEEEIF